MKLWFLTALNALTHNCYSIWTKFVSLRQNVVERFLRCLTLSTPPHQLLRDLTFHLRVGSKEFQISRLKRPEKTTGKKNANCSQSRGATPKTSTLRGIYTGQKRFWHRGQTTRWNWSRVKLSVFYKYVITIVDPEFIPSTPCDRCFVNSVSCR